MLVSRVRSIQATAIRVGRRQVEEHEIMAVDSGRCQSWPHRTALYAHTPDRREYMIITALPSWELFSLGRRQLHR